MLPNKACEDAALVIHNTSLFEYAGCLLLDAVALILSELATAATPL
jgi:hypothetical protein